MVEAGGPAGDPPVVVDVLASVVDPDLVTDLDRRGRRLGAERVVGLGTARDERPMLLQAVPAPAVTAVVQVALHHVVHLVEDVEQPQVHLVDAPGDEPVEPVVEVVAGAGLEGHDRLGPAHAVVALQAIHAPTRVPYAGRLVRPHRHVAAREPGARGGGPFAGAAVQHVLPVDRVVGEDLHVAGPVGDDRVGRMRPPAHTVLGHLHAEAHAVQVLCRERVRVGPQPGRRAVVPLVLDVQHLEASRRVVLRRVQDDGLRPGARPRRQVEDHVGVHAVDRADAEPRLLPVHAVGGLGVADARVGQADAGTDREVVLHVLVPALEQAVGGVSDHVEAAGAEVRRVLPRLIAPHQRVGGVLARGVAPPRDVLDAGDDVVVDEELAGVTDFLEGVLAGIRVVHPYSGSKRNPNRSASRRWKRSLMPRGSTFTASRPAQRTRCRTASPVNRTHASRS